MAYALAGKWSVGKETGRKRNERVLEARKECTSPEQATGQREHQNGDEAETYFGRCFKVGPVLHGADMGHWVTSLPYPRLSFSISGIESTLSL